MMKKNWEMPKTVVQRFEPNEYVAACVTGTIQCAYPGDPKYYGPGRSSVGRTNVFDDWNGRESGWYTDQDGMQHGVCGNNATISFNGNTGTGFEYVNGRPDHNRPIYDISGYQLEEGTYYNVTWTSNDSGSPEYHHIGRLIITNIDHSRPNHS